MQDVELHELHGVFHAGRAWRASVPASASENASSASADAPSLSQGKRARKRRREREEDAQQGEVAIRRTCWRRVPGDADGHHFGEGVGVADWLSKNNGGYQVGGHNLRNR